MAKDLFGSRNCTSVVSLKRSFTGSRTWEAHQSEPIWSRSEKAIARTTFDAALGRELHEVIQETRRMAKEIQNWNTG